MAGIRARAAKVDRRVGLLFAIFIALLAIALARALYLGTVKASALRVAAVQQQIDVQPVPAQRGMISDSSGTPLALSQNTEDLIADPYLIVPDGDAQPIADRIAPALHLPRRQVLDALTKPGTGYSPIAKQLSPHVADSITQLTIAGKPISGLYTEPDTKEVYPLGDTLAQVLGAVSSSTGRGITGLQESYNKVLAGTAGERKIVKDGKGSTIDVEQVKEMEPGASMRLTVSAPLQNEMEQVLAGVGQEYQPKLATAIALNPRTGAILGLANYPAVNANNPFEGTSAEVNNAIQDHALSFSYEPGSTFKPITVAGALQDGLITPSTQFQIPSALHPYTSTITDAEQHGDETLTTAGILAQSSNIGADLIGQRLGAERFNAWVHRFGLGRLTGVHLPGEQAGTILPPSQYSGTSMYTLPFGQGESVTPIQMATVYGAIANGGILRTPHIVQSIDGKPVPEPRGHRVISTTTAAEIRNMLRGVLSDTGTDSGGAIPGYDLAGKTGTAQIAVDGKYSKTEFVASFMGMVPASDPRLVVAIVVDDPHGNIYGGSVAGPAFQKIVGWAVPYFGIDPNPAHVTGQDPVGVPLQ
jgi:cell division protein FtsI (penicillin-binding protein 3)